MRQGDPSAVLLCRAFLRSTYLEATAVPELRNHAERLALTIAHEVA